jgi:hypothetical protein
VDEDLTVTSGAWPAPRELALARVVDDLPLLFEERVEVAAPVPVVEGKRVAGEDPPEPGISVELLLGRAAVARPEPRPLYLVVVAREVRR